MLAGLDTLSGRVAVGWDRIGRILAVGFYSHVSVVIGLGNVRWAQGKACGHANQPTTPSSLAEPSLPRAWCRGPATEPLPIRYACQINKASFMILFSYINYVFKFTNYITFILIILNYKILIFNHDFFE